MCLAGVTFLRIICFSLTSSSGHTLMSPVLTILDRIKAVNEGKLQLMLLITSSGLISWDYKSSICHTFEGQAIDKFGYWNIYLWCTRKAY
jgi:hypothetical protein